MAIPAYALLNTSLAFPFNHHHPNKRSLYIIESEYVREGEMKTSVLELAILILFLAACARVPEERPPDLALTLYWDNGTLAPQNRYEFIITIGPGNQGQLAYQFGYSSGEQTQRYTADFTLTETQLDDLYLHLQTSGAFGGQWEAERTLIGGSTTSLIVTAYAKEYQVPSTAELREEQREQAKALIEGVRGFVPEATWEKLDEQRVIYQASFE